MLNVKGMSKVFQDQALCKQTIVHNPKDKFGKKHPYPQAILSLEVLLSIGQGRYRGFLEVRDLKGNYHFYPEQQFCTF